MVDFSEIPASLLTPGIYVEIDPSLANQGVGVFPFRGLIIAQKTSSGTGAAETVIRITSESQARELFGPGSQCHLMAAAWLAENRSTALDVVALDDAGGSAAAQGTVTFGGSISAGGTLPFYVAGKRLLVPVETSTDQVASNLADAINADGDLPVTASDVGSNVTITAKNAGAGGNAIDLRAAFLPGESIPSGLTVSITAMGSTTTGSGDPDIADALVVIADSDYDVMATPYNDPANLATLKADLVDRADAMQGIPAMAFVGHALIFSLLSALFEVHNSPFVCFLGFEPFAGISWVRVAAVAAIVAYHGAIDPVRPWQTLSVSGYAPPDGSRFSREERNQILEGGLSTLRYTSAGDVQIERLRTTYYESPGGSPDASYQDVNTMLGLKFLRRSAIARLLNLFPRHKLAGDNALVAQGSKLATPAVIKAELVSWYNELVAEGICEDPDTFKSETVVEIEPTDPNRVNILLAANLVNQFRVGAVAVQFRR